MREAAKDVPEVDFAPGEAPAAAQVHACIIVLIHS